MNMERTVGREVAELTPEEQFNQLLTVFRMKNPFSPEKRQTFLASLPPVRELNLLPEIERREDEKNRQLSEEEVVKIIKIALAWTEDFWKEEFRSIGKTYKPPRLVVFSEQTNTGCGPLHKSTGPIYCPTDGVVYIDPTFALDFEHKYWAGADEVSVAYVIFHEISHAVQTQLGIWDPVLKLMQQSGPTIKNLLYVAYEMQADFLTGAALHGVNRDRQILHEGDAKNLYWTAAAIGDDMMQLRARQGDLMPSEFTHGDARQRAASLWQGLQSGDWKGALDYGAFLQIAAQTHRSEITKTAVRRVAAGLASG